MRVLITGGSACGKSTYAEALAASLPGPRCYIATMRPYDAECLAKIARHRAQRADRGFVTIERETGLAALTLPARGTALLECMCNLTANEMFDPVSFAMRDPFDAVMAGVCALEKQCAHLIIVTNEVGSEYYPYDPATQAYIQTLGKLNQALAERFERVVELVCGIAIPLKGELP